MLRFDTGAAFYSGQPDGLSVKFRLDKKLVVFALAVAALAALSTAALSVGLIDVMLREGAGEKLDAESQDAGLAVRTLIESRIVEFSRLASDPAIVDASLGGPQVSALVSLANFQATYGGRTDVRDAAVFGAGMEKRLDLGGGAAFDEGFVRSLASGRLAGFSEEPGGALLMVALPLDGGGVLAVAAGTDGVTRLMNADRDERWNLRLASAGGVNLPPGPDSPLADSCFSDGLSGSGAYDGPDGRLIGAAHCQPEYGYAVLAEAAEADVLEPLLDLEMDMAVVGLSVTGALAALSYMLSRRLSDPLRRLTRAAGEVARGNFDVRTGIRTSDEIGDLSRSFDTMAARLLESEIALVKQKEIISQQEDILLRFSDRTEDACVCFVDIQGSTRVCMHLDEDAAASLYATFINSMASVVGRHGGTVVKNVGDALLFYFPAEKPLEVIECCMAMCEYRDDLCSLLDKAGLPHLDYRVSATLGPVSIARVSTSEINDIFGSTVNACSKINSFARPNGLVIGESLHGVVSGAGGFSFERGADFHISDNRDLAIYHVRRAESGPAGRTDA